MSKHRKKMSGSLYETSLQSASQVLRNAFGSSRAGQQGHRYQLLPTRDDEQNMTEAPTQVDDIQDISRGRLPMANRAKLSRKKDIRLEYTGALLFNLASFVLPALYGTLSKLWVANIDPSLVVTTDAYVYISIFAEVINEGLPRAAWVIIGDKTSRSWVERMRLTHTLILFQSILGLILSIVFATAASRFVDSFVPEGVRTVSLTYIRLSAFSALSTALETAVATSTRALDKPDVPLIISSIKFLVNIILDLCLISPFHAGGPSVRPSVNLQAGIQVACNLCSAFIGLAYFLYTNTFSPPPPNRPDIEGMAVHATDQDNRPDTEGRDGEEEEEEEEESQRSPAPTISALITLARPGSLTFLESLIRNVLYLWLVVTIIAMGPLYATAWGIFNTIRWGLVMVPVQAFEATALTFVGHNWGFFRATDAAAATTSPPPSPSPPEDPTIATTTTTTTTETTTTRKTDPKKILQIVSPALASLCGSLVIEIPLAIFLSLFGAYPFARYLSGGNEDVARVTAYMWRSLDWCYVFYAASTQLATILLATRPRWYLYQSMASNLCYVLPWAVVCQVAMFGGDEDDDGRSPHAWWYYSWVFGGSLVFSLVDIGVVVGVWALVLWKGRMKI